MEQEPKQIASAGGLGALAGLAAACLLLLVCLSGSRAQSVETAARAALDVSRTAAEETETLPELGDRVIPMGQTIGIKLFSDGVLVVGVSPVETENGACYPGRDGGLKTGDRITHINGSEVDTIEAVQAMVKEREGEPLTIQAVRGEHSLQLSVAAVANAQGVYQLGVWLRDSMAGIGTMTFYDPQSGRFGALGHGINDVDTAMLMPMESGGIMRSTVTDVKKGLGGQPGELHGTFELTKDMGTLYANTNEGVFGTVAAECAPEGTAIPVARKNEIKTGAAVIRSNVRGEQVEEFDVEITHLDLDARSGKNMMIRVTDPDLLDVTGGIVQGMSGSPILQNGRIVGAVTHVLVNDPTRGYGIFIENMLDAAG